MQQKVVALSRCLGETSAYSRFHFKGVYLGHKIVEINLSLKDNTASFKAGRDYLLYIGVKEIIDHRLVGDLIRSKRV